MINRYSRTRTSGTLWEQAFSPARPRFQLKSKRQRFPTTAIQCTVLYRKKLSMVVTNINARRRLNRRWKWTLCRTTPCFVTRCSTWPRTLSLFCFNHRKSFGVVCHPTFRIFCLPRPRLRFSSLPLVRPVLG